MSDNVTAIKGLRRFVFSGQRRFHPYGSCSAGNLFPLRLYRTAHSYPRADGTVLRGIGTETDVVQKEMYTFPDRKGRSLTLRPEATAGVMRAYIESGRSGDAVTQAVHPRTHVPLRAPPEGRMEAFHQINCECLGLPNPTRTPNWSRWPCVSSKRWASRI